MNPSLTSKSGICGALHSTRFVLSASTILFRMVLINQGLTGMTFRLQIIISYTSNTFLWILVCRRWLLVRKGYKCILICIEGHFEAEHFKAASIYIMCTFLSLCWSSVVGFLLYIRGNRAFPLQSPYGRRTKTHGPPLNFAKMVDNDSA